MRQLTSLDAQFLALENARQTGHVGSLAILDPSTAPDGAFGCARGHARCSRERLPLLPPLRWRLAEVPLGLDYPYWVDDAEFDLGYHVREMALASPGTDEQLAEQVARIISRPLDRARPLWELYVIEGLESGYVAVLTKIHHAVIDGLSGAEIMGAAARPHARGARAAGRAETTRAEPAPGQLRDARARAARRCRATRCGCCARCRRAIPNLEDTPFGDASRARGRCRKRRRRAAPRRRRSGRT